MKIENSLNKINIDQVKKAWEKPELYVLARGCLKGGGSGTSQHEIRTGNHKVKTDGGGTAMVSTPAYLHASKTS